MKDIEFIYVKKSYGKNTIMENFNLKIYEGERLILLGPSGCGKSTTLRMIAGFEDITSGDLFMNGKRVNDVPSGERNVSMVFQNYALYPHMSAKKNIIYALERNKIPEKEIQSRYENVVEILGMKEYQDRKPAELSGGQMQRVALARAIVKRSKYLLLDEPLSNLDAKLRIIARQELINIHEKYGHTFIYVTHDQEEAMTLSNRIALMRDGNIEMLAKPSIIYNRPKNVYCASFIGSPATNILRAEYVDNNLYIENFKIEIDDQWKNLINKNGNRNLYVGIRAEHIHMLKEKEDNMISAEIQYIEDLGKNFKLSLKINENQIWVLSSRTIWKKGDVVHFIPNQNKLYIFDGSTEESIGFPESHIKQNPKYINVEN